MKKGWVDQKVNELLDRGLKDYVCASGISVSGILHPGKLRDIFIANQVHKGLLSNGRNSELVYFIDDFDRLPKAPIWMPGYEKYVGMPYCDIPSPNPGQSFVDYFFESFQKGLKELDIHPHLIHESERYRAGFYNDEINLVHNNASRIAQIVQSIKGKPVDESSLFHAYCESCGKDSPTDKKLNSDKTFEYTCACGHEGSCSIFEPGRVKMSWIVNWPSRWNKENTSFEPIGADHASPNGCFDISKEIYRSVFGKNTPVTQRYEFIKLPSGQNLSSSGTKVSLEDMMAVYDPSVVQWIFESRHPEVAFSIDLANPFETYNKADQEIKTDLPSFKEIVRTLQSNLGRYPTSNTMSEDLQRRVQRAQHWIAKYSPSNTSQQFLTVPGSKVLSEQDLAVRRKIVGLVGSALNETEIEEAVYAAIRQEKLEAKAQFRSIYEDLFGRPFGPKLSKIICAGDKEILNRLLLRT